MSSLKLLGVVITLLLILSISFLLVMLNPLDVRLDLFGLIFIEQSLGLLILLAFVCGIFFALALLFLPNQFLAWRNTQLKRKLDKS